MKDLKKLAETQGGDQMLAAARQVPAELGIDTAEHVPHNNFRKLPEYEQETLLSEGSDEGYALAVMQKVPSVA